MTTTLAPAPATGRSRPRHRVRFLSTLIALRAEVHKYLVGWLAGWRGVLIQMAIFPAAYMLFLLFIGRGHIHQDLLVPVLIGTVPLAFLHEQVNRSFWGYLADIQSGVLEQTYLTPLPSWALIAGRQIGCIIAALPLAISTYVVGLIIIDAHHVALPYDPAVIVPMAAIALGTVGLALLLSGLTLVFKRIEIVTEAAMTLPFVVGGAFVPLDHLPDWVAVLSRLLVPVAPGIEAMRDILIGHRTLGTLTSGWGIGWLIAQPILLIILGTVLFGWLERIARRRGTLGRY